MEIWRAAGDSPVFEGAPATWSADQVRLVKITREYVAAFTALAQRQHEPPAESILRDYYSFRQWRDAYAKDPKDEINPRKYSHGFR